jgi:predicted RNA-binding Zn-ribbon protein involved in translation (DUF1610 family)
VVDRWSTGAGTDSTRRRPDDLGTTSEEVTMNTEATFGATCPECGAVELAADQLWLVLLSAPGEDHYDFHCPSCSTLVRRPADAATVAVLSCLVAVEHLDVPAEARETHSGDALTVDDLIDLMLELETSFAAAA